MLILNFILFTFLFLSFIHSSSHANIDKTLEKEFLAILKQCDISTGNNSTSSTDSNTDSSTDSSVDNSVDVSVISNVNSNVNSIVNSNVNSNINSNINSNVYSNVYSNVNSNNNNTSSVINIQKPLSSDSIVLHIDIPSESFESECTEKSVISDNINIQSESYDGDVDSAHCRRNIRAVGMQTEVVPTNQASITMFPVSARSPRIPWIHFRISKLIDNATSPLLNTNAIHERRSVCMRTIQENCSNDDVPDMLKIQENCSNDDALEYKEQKLPEEGSI